MVNYSQAEAQVPGDAWWGLQVPVSANSFQPPIFEQLPGPSCTMPILSLPSTPSLAASSLYNTPLQNSSPDQYLFLHHKLA